MKATRHWDVGYNFIIETDTLVVQEDAPMHLLLSPEGGDSVVFTRGNEVVVAQVDTIPEDTVDSVWVKIARDQWTQGWLHESELVAVTVPRDPISQGIHIFSNAHLPTAVALMAVAVVAWMVRRLSRARYHIVHIDDIASPFPMLLCLAVASAATLYSTIQLRWPDLWQAYYYHPTLNPFALPLPLAGLLALLWLMIALLGASLMDIRRNLPAGEAVLYALSLTAIVAVAYVVFSRAVMWGVGYPLLAIYIIMSLAQYLRRHRARWECGACGAHMHDVGQCPKCGQENE